MDERVRAIMFCAAIALIGFGLHVRGNGDGNGGLAKFTNLSAGFT